MGNGRQGLLQARCAVTNSDEKAQKHQHRRHHRFGSADAFVPHPTEHEGPQSLSLISLWLLAKRLEQSDDRQTIAVKSAVGRTSVCAHPMTKGAKEFGFRRWWYHRGSRRHESDRLQEAHKVA